jgi:hypothetical protein
MCFEMSESGVRYYVTLAHTLNPDMGLMGCSKMTRALLGSDEPGARVHHVSLPGGIALVSDEKDENEKVVSTEVVLPRSVVGDIEVLMDVIYLPVENKPVTLYSYSDEDCPGDKILGNVVKIASKA